MRHITLPIYVYCAVLSAFGAISCTSEQDLGEGLAGSNSGATGGTAGSSGEAPIAKGGAVSGPTKDKDSNVGPGEEAQGGTSGQGLTIKNFNVDVREGLIRLTFALSNQIEKRVLKCQGATVSVSTGEQVHVRWNPEYASEYSANGLCSGFSSLDGAFCADAQLSRICDDGNWLMPYQTSTALELGAFWGKETDPWRQPGTEYKVHFKVLMADAEVIEMSATTTL